MELFTAALLCESLGLECSVDACFRHGITAAALLVNASKVCMSSRTVFEHLRGGKGAEILLDCYKTAV